MSRSVPSVDAARTPAAAMTLAQSEVLAPVALVLANLLLAGFDRVARLFGRV